MRTHRHLVCHDTSGGCGNGAGNETGAEHGEGAIEAGALDVIFGVGAAYRPLLQRLVRAIESLVLYDEASLQQIAWRNSNISLEVLQLEANGVCIV